MEASGQWLRWRPARCVARWRRTMSSSRDDSVDALLHPAAVGFQLRFAFAAAHADAARLPRQVAPEPRQARQQMLELRQLDLQLAFARAGALGEDVENQRRAVQDFAVENLFEVAALRGRQFVVENDGVHVLAPAKFGEFLRLALADERGGAGASIFWMPSPTTSPPAVAASSTSSASESRVSRRRRDLNSAPMRNTRSGRVFLVSMSAFNVSHLHHSTNHG